MCRFKGVVLSFVFFLPAFVCSAPPAAAERLNVTASIYPLAHFAEQVGGSYLNVIQIMPHGTEPHAYEPTPQDLKALYESRVFIFQGGGIDSWAERIHADIVKQGTTVLKMTDAIELNQFDDKHNSTDHDRHADDPHTWLDPLLAIREVQVIRDTLIKADPARTNEYTLNSKAYINALQSLHASYEKGLQSCKRRDIIVTHNAYRYLARRYNIHTRSIKGLSPDEEPSPRMLGELSRLAVNKGIRHVFIEELTSPRLAATLAEEVGASLLVLSPLGALTGSQRDKGHTYVSIMEQNLHNLRTAMECR